MGGRGDDSKRLPGVATSAPVAQPARAQSAILRDDNPIDEATRIADELCAARRMGAISGPDDPFAPLLAGTIHIFGGHVI